MYVRMYVCILLVTFTRNYSSYSQHDGSLFTCTLACVFLPFSPAVDSFRDSSDYSSEILTLRHGEGTFPDCYLTVSYANHSCTAAHSSPVVCGNHLL